jgi:formate C-acetyltransferase
LLLSYLSCCLQYNLLGVMDDEKIRLREEVQEQIRALKELKEMAASYGDDISKPAGNSREAVQVRASGSCKLGC